MKIALQLYGHLRTFRQCAPALKANILDYYDVDIFIHTWDRTEHGDKSWYSNGIKCKPENVDDSIIAEIHDLYSPKAIKIETQNLFEEDGHYGTHNEIKVSLRGMKYMTYSQYMANKLRTAYEEESGVTYDYVLVMRPDVLPYVPINIAEYQSEFDFFKKTSIHFVHNSEIKVRYNKVLNYPLIADCFYFAKPETISKITSLYEDFDYFYKDIVQTLPPQVENPEITFFENIVQKGVVPRQYINYFAIKRYEDRDDIRLIPPEKIGTTSRKGAKSTKRFLEIFSRCAPDFIIRKFIGFFDIMGTCGRYLQALENRK